MNTRIRKLAFAAVADSTTCSLVSPGVKGTVPIDFIEKLTEMIIQECDQVLFEEAEGRIIGDEVDVAGILNQHFGIK